MVPDVPTGKRKFPFSELSRQSWFHVVCRQRRTQARSFCGRTTCSDNILNVVAVAYFWQFLLPWQPDTGYWILDKEITARLARVRSAFGGLKKGGSVILLALNPQYSVLSFAGVAKTRSHVCICDVWIPTRLLYGQLPNTKRQPAGQRKRYKDQLLTNFKSRCNMFVQRQGYI